MVTLVSSVQLPQVDIKFIQEPMMRRFVCLPVILVALAFCGCTQPPYLASIQVLPATPSLTAFGQTLQFQAIGTYERAGNHPTQTEDITSQVTWKSSTTGVATINSAGLATAAGSGTSTISATMSGIVGSESLQVTATTTAVHDLISIAVTPASGQALTSIGESAQFIAIGTYNTIPITADITNQVTWQSSNANIATINSTGLALGIVAGSTSITAIGTANDGSAIARTATLQVTATPTSVHDLLSVAVIPTGQTTATISEPAQFIAIGTYTTIPLTLDITNAVTWSSSDVKIATINSAGLAISNAVGTTTIIAIGTATDGAAIAGTSTITVVPTGGAVPLPILSLYEVGLGSGTVVSSPIAGSVGLNCTVAGAAGCTGNFPLGVTVTLTETPASGSTFGGWSADCMIVSATQCTIAMNNNEPVGAIFNN
jgi:hypothetical protein